jgi:hypothetical protein
VKKMEWVMENWIFILFAVIFIGMHLSGHGCCGGHGKHGRDGEHDKHKHSHMGSSEKKGGRSCH